MGLTEGLTFIEIPPSSHGSTLAAFGCLLKSPGDSALGQVIRRHLDRYSVARDYPYAVHPQLAGYIGENLVTVCQLNLDLCAGKSLGYGTRKFNYILF